MTAVFANVDREPARADEMRRDVKVARWVATIAGLIGFVLSIATPLLPVVQTTATLNWPQNGVLANVTSPLITQTPVSMTVTVPCDVIRGHAAAGRSGAGHRTEGRQTGRAQRAAGQRHRQPRRHHRPQRRGGELCLGPKWFRPACQRIELTSSEAGTYATFVGLTDSTGKPLRTGFDDPNLRPAIVGVFTDLTGPPRPG